MLQKIIHFVYFCLPVCEVWLPKDYVFWLSSLYQRAAPSPPYPTLGCATSGGIFKGSIFVNSKSLSTSSPYTLLPAYTEAAPKDLLAQTCIDFGQVANSIIGHFSISFCSNFNFIITQSFQYTKKNELQTRL